MLFGRRSKERQRERFQLPYLLPIVVVPPKAIHHRLGGSCTLLELFALLIPPVSRILAKDAFGLVQFALIDERSSNGMKIVSQSIGERQRPLGDLDPALFL